MQAFSWFFFQPSAWVDLILRYSRKGKHDKHFRVCASQAKLTFLFDLSKYSWHRLNWKTNCFCPPPYPGKTYLLACSTEWSVSGRGRKFWSFFFSNIYLPLLFSYILIVLWSDIEMKLDIPTLENKIFKAKFSLFSSANLQSSWGNRN